nr:hypothetical protein [Brevundimonas naejangsanensis]
MNNSKARRAIAILLDKEWLERVARCESIEENGFALIVKFVRIEAALKLLRYDYNGRKDWPDKLNFLNANWQPLRDLKRSSGRNYDALIGSGGKSILKIRNQIAHEAMNIAPKDYIGLSDVANWGMDFLVGEALAKFPN